MGPGRSKLDSGRSMPGSNLFDLLQSREKGTERKRGTRVGRGGRGEGEMGRCV